MSSANVVTATFPSSRYAVAAVDWFLNQAIDRDAVSVAVVPKGERSRPPGPGDNRRLDLIWIVSLDVDRARLPKRLAIETMKREGGEISKEPLAGV